MVIGTPVESTGFGGVYSTITISTLSVPSASVVVVYVFSALVPTGCSDNLNGTYTQQSQITSGSGRYATIYTVNASSGTPTITITCSAADLLYAVATYVTGAIVDQVATNTNSFSASAPTSGSVTTTSADIVMGMFMPVSVISGTVVNTAGAGYTTLTTTYSNLSQGNFLWEYIQQGSAGTIDPPMVNSNSANTDLLGNTIAFAPSGGSAPTITVQPANETIYSGQTATFSVTATGVGTLTYQWYLNSVTIGGATSVSYTTPTLTTAANGNLYAVAVSNSNGTTYSTAATLTVNALTVPGAPTGASASAGNASATVTFVAPSSNGGSTITGYTVTSSPAGGTDTNAGSTSLTHSINGLTNGVVYTFTVTATNSIGTGTASAASNSVTPSTVPGAPTGASATAGNASATVTFVAPSSNGGSTITGYTVTSSPAGGTDTNAGSTGLTHTVTGLTNGTAYTFTVTATNAAGTGSASAASNSVTPATASVPGAPTGAVAAAGNTQAFVTFSAPSSNGGSPITGYTVISNPVGGTDSNAGSTSLGHTVTGLTNGTAYTFTVTATNSVGTGAASSASNSVTPEAVPGPPTGATAALTGNTTATVSFVAPTNIGGGAISGYTVVSNPIGAVDTNAGSTSLGHNIIGLSINTVYTFTVAATNSFGTGIPSLPSNGIQSTISVGLPTFASVSTVSTDFLQANGSWAAIQAAIVVGLPTTLPGSSGVLWNNGGVLSIS